jgi:hypothetical protein
MDAFRIFLLAPSRSSSPGVAFTGGTEVVSPPRPIAESNGFVPGAKMILSLAIFWQQVKVGKHGRCRRRLRESFLRYSKTIAKRRRKCAAN